MLTFGLRLVPDRLTVRNARIRKLRFHIGLILQLRADNIKVYLAEAGKKHVAGFGIFIERDGGIFLQELVQAGKDFVLFPLFLRADRKADARLWEFNRIKFHRCGSIAKRISGRSELQLRQRADIACNQLIDLNGLLAAHDINRARLLALLTVAVVRGNSCIQRTAVNLDDGILAELIHNRLYNLCSKLTVLLDFNRLSGFCVHSLGSFCFACRRHIIYQIVQQRGDADVRLRRTAAHRRNYAFLNAKAQTCKDFLTGKLAFLKVFFHQRFIRLCSSLGEGFIKLLCAAFQCGRDRHFLLALTVKLLSRHVWNVNIADKRTLLHDGKLNRHHARPKLRVHSFHNLIEIGVLTIHLVHDHHACFAGFLALFHGFFRSHNGAGNSADHDQRGICKRHSRRNLTIEIEEPGCIDDIQLHVFPLKGCKRSVNGDRALYLFRIVVRGRGAVLHPAKALKQAGVEEHGLGKRGFTLAAMAEDTDVADVCCGVIFHCVMIPPHGINEVFRCGRIIWKCAKEGRITHHLIF